MTTIDLGKHRPVDAFDVADGELMIGGIKVSRLAARVGQTPFYAYDRNLISERIALLRKHLPQRLHLHYAIKANPMPAVVHHIAPQVDGLDVASSREMAVALDAGVAPERISFAGPGKRAQEIEQCVAAGVVLTIESEAQLEQVLRARDRLGMAALVAVRVNPDFEVKLSGMKMGGGAKQFGIDQGLVLAVLRRLAVEKLDMAGLHIFSGSQNLNAAAICEAQQRSVDLALDLLASAGIGTDWINIGGGFGIPYFPGEQSLDLSVIGDNLAGLCDRVEAATASKLVIELGRFIVGEAGVYICQVIERKVSHDQVYLICDGGLHHHLSASGNFGQVIRKNYPVAIANRIGSATQEIQSVVGPLCTPLDLLADKMLLPAAAPGDLVAVFQSGAYGLTASPTAFLSHPAPVEVLV